MKNINNNKKARLPARQELLTDQREELFRTLKARFEKNMNRHKGLNFYTES